MSINDSAPGDGAQSISSTGAGLLCFKVEEPSRLAWTNSGGKPFAVSGRGVSINSNRRRGEVELDPGKYTSFYVRGAAWTIVVRPR